MSEARVLDGEDGELARRGKWLEDEGDGWIVQAEGDRRDGSWGGSHFWGFEEVEGERRHVRWIRIWKRGGEKVVLRMVYDWEGE